jgi:hypothetical protein
MATGCATRIGDDVGIGTETGAGDGDGDFGNGDGDGDVENSGGGMENGDGDGDSGDGDGDSPQDMTYLFALQTSLGPDLPLLFVLDVDNVTPTVTPSGPASLADFTFQALSLEQGSTTPGECIGELLQYDDVVIDLLGEFELDMGLVMVSGEANPITGGDVEATLQLIGHLVDPDAMCGDVQGMLTSPLEYDLVGSTFAAIPLPDGCESDFPAVIPYVCSMLP